MTDKQELRRLAEAALPGKWRAGNAYDKPFIPKYQVIVDTVSGPYVIMDGNKNFLEDAEANVAFVGAAYPAAILALLEELDSARSALSDIAKKTSESRSVTRRLMWIEGRATSALEGKDWAKHVFMMPDPKNAAPKAERLQTENKMLKIELEACKAALSAIAKEVDGNIRPTVRDIINGIPDGKDIYGYCDTIDGIISRAVDGKNG